MRCQKILQSSDVEVKRSHFDFVASTVEVLLKSSAETPQSSLNVAHLISLFTSQTSVDAILCSSSLFSRAGTGKQVPASTEALRQLSAKLHCYYGVPVDPVGRRSFSTHPYARSYVYDLRNYTDKTEWGPFRDDGSMRVDWEMVEAIMIVLGYNARVFGERTGGRFTPGVWNEPFSGIGRSGLSVSCLSTLPNEPDIPLELKDPYSISGAWMRIVCFLDYNDLYDFNFASERIPGDQPRGPLTIGEEIRVIVMKLKITKLEAPGQFDNQALPIAHFTGTSRSLDASWDPNANSRIRGTVMLTPEGEVRWTSISILYGGEERWRSEGIQIGGLRSKRGVIGTWFDKDYDPHGPAGPTAYWKLSDNARYKPVADDAEPDEDSE